MGSRGFQAGGTGDESGCHPQQEETDLSDMTKAELVGYASEIGVEIAGNKTKAEIIDLITEAENG